jgi:hypothetical protein
MQRLVDSGPKMLTKPAKEGLEAFVYQLAYAVDAGWQFCIAHFEISLFRNRNA